MAEHCDGARPETGAVRWVVADGYSVSDVIEPTTDRTDDPHAGLVSHGPQRCEIRRAFHARCLREARSPDDHEPNTSPRAVLDCGSGPISRYRNEGHIGRGWQQRHVGISAG